jgi:hypothetical protein
VPKASKAQRETELGKIRALVAEDLEGLSRQAISTAYAKRYNEKLSDRTLQRRLEELVVRQEITQKGEGRSTVYRTRDSEERPLASGEDYVPLSAQGTKIRDLVRLPISRRPPVGYDADWLFSYVPGKTWYLPKAVRTHLYEAGKTPDENRPAGTFAREVLGRLLIDLAWASSRLEGNTYSRLDTQNLLEFGQRAEGKDAQEAQMILNHKAAIEHLVSETPYVGFNRHTLLTLHAALSENLLGDPADEGRLRERPVSITGTTYTPSGIPQVIRECFDRILESGAKIPDPFETAFFAMVHIPYLQPFADVNKRTSRLAANIPLIAANVCPLSFIDVPERAYLEGTLGVYEQKRVDLLRDVFIHAYERSCAQYRVVRDSLAQPDAIRLRYRSQLAEVVADVVRAGEPPRAEYLRRRAEDLGVPPDDIDIFSERALELLLSLHEGSAGRYRILPSQFEAWKAQFRSGKS